MKGYRYIAVDGVSYRASRLAWLYMTGEWPPEQVDHRDGRHGDDSWRNLRLATNAENAQNKLAAKTNTSGFAGVSFHKKSGKWRATISVSGKPKHLGLRDTPEEASALYIEAKRKHHPFLDRA